MYQKEQMLQSGVSMRTNVFLCWFRCVVVAAVVCVCLCLPVRKASAQFCNSGTAELTLTAGMAFGLPTAITLIGGTVRMIQEKHAPGWATGGILSGAFGLVFSGLILASGLSQRCSGDAGPVTVNVGLMILHMATLGIGIANGVLVAKRRHTGKIRRRFRWKRRRNRYRYFRRSRRSAALPPVQAPTTASVLLQAH